MSWKAGEEIMYRGKRKATLVKPMTPYGFTDSHGNKGQCWELKFEGQPETVYRWLYPALDGKKETGGNQ